MNADRVSGCRVPSAVGGAALPGLSFGIAERLSFDTLTVWTAAVGVAVLVGRGRHGEPKEIATSAESNP